MDNFLSNLQTYIGNNSLFAYPLVFLGGILISFTSCVYPVIPIVVGFIGASSSSSLKRSFLLSLAYILGLSLVYAGLGALASLTGFFLGQITSSPWTYFILGNVFIFLGISALGLYDMPFIGFKKTSLDKPRNYGGSFLVGAASGFIIGPCTAPALGVILAYVATRKSIIFGVTLLFTFALGMSLLLLCLGTFSSLIKKIPKTGKFNMVVEKIFGVILLGTGEFFLIMAGKRFV
jgi:thiol:disulfide interchange protein DsbD